MSQGARATIAVIALYALVLQAFFSGMLPAPGSSGHGFAELCSPAQSDGGAPTKHDAKGCCTAACAPLTTPLPALDVATLAWPTRAAIVAAFDATLPPPARGPPIHAHSPRGPPAA